MRALRVCVHFVCACTSCVRALRVCVLRVRVRACVVRGGWGGGGDENRIESASREREYASTEGETQG